MSVLSAALPAHVTLPPLVRPGEELTADEVQRYSRHLLIPQIGAIGQRRLKNARVLVIGAGGLGSPALLYLAAAGIGTIGIVDDDTIDPSNLQRQVIHRVPDVGRSKAQSARDAIAALNPLVDVQLHPVRLTGTNALDICAGYDLIVDGSDNFATRYLVSDSAAILGIPHVWGAVLQFDGQVSTFWNTQGPSYRDLYPEAPPAGSVPSCGEGGVFGMLCGVVGSLMVAEVIKLVTGVGRSLLGRLLIVDSLASSSREISVTADPDREPVTELIDYEMFCGVTPADSDTSLSVHELATLIAQKNRGEVSFDLIDVRQPGEYDIVRIPGSVLVPLGLIISGADIAAVSAERDIILYCKSGTRSAAALQELRRRGFTRVQQLRGGVLDWVAEVDPALPTY